jgi:hypothetical protein
VLWDCSLCDVHDCLDADIVGPSDRSSGILPDKRAYLRCGNTGKEVLQLDFIKVLGVVLLCMASLVVNEGNSGGLLLGTGLTTDQVDPMPD